MRKRKNKKKKKPVTSQQTRRLPFPTLRIECYDRSTYVYLDGMEIAGGVLEVNFKAGGVGGDPPVLDLKMEPYAVTLRRVKKERIETTLSSSSHSPLAKGN